jgi:hypothetical protein
VAALVVYESMFGNTEQVARAVARGIRDVVDADVREVSEVPDGVDPTVDLLVVGAPTHAFGLSRPSTRADAVRQGAEQDDERRGLREWLEQLPQSGGDGAVAAFDTRVRRVRHLPGSAARGAVKILRAHGYRATASHSFYVEDVSGPLLPGELDRAAAWGREIASDRADQAARQNA